MSYDSDDILRFRTGVDQVTTFYVAGLGVVTTQQRHQFTGMAEPDGRSSSGNLTTCIPTIWNRQNCVIELNSPQTFVYTRAIPSVKYCAGGYQASPFGMVEKWSQVYTWDYTNWTNHDAQYVTIPEDCTTVPADGGWGGWGGWGGGSGDDDPPPPGERECRWVSGPGYGYWLCVTG